MYEYESQPSSHENFCNWNTANWTSSMGHWKVNISNIKGTHTHGFSGVGLTDNSE